MSLELNNVNFGKYEIPPTLLALNELGRELAAEGKGLYDGTNFYLKTDDYRYFNTPCDVVVLGNIGADGIHYGFLTDFGTVSHLEDAPIVCVSPMDFDQPTKVIAANIREFLRVNLTDEALFYNTFADEMAYMAQKEKWDDESRQSPYGPTEEAKRIRQDIISRLKERVILPEIANPFIYVTNIQKARQLNVVVPTQDGLGVVLSGPSTEIPPFTEFPIPRDSQPNLSELKAYLKTASYASKLAVVRDIQLQDLTSDEELCTMILSEMVGIGLTAEAARIEMG